MNGTSASPWIQILPFYQEFDQFQPDELPEVLQLLRTAHVPYLQNGLGQLPASFASLDASRPWICYWIIHSLALLDAKLPDKPNADDIVFFLSCCQNPEGGYGGGPMQMSHLAPTYAAVCALIELGSETALRSIDRAKIYAFLKDMAIPAGEVISSWDIIRTKQFHTTYKYGIICPDYMSFLLRLSI